MRPYHPANLKLVPYAGWRVILLAWAAKYLGIQCNVAAIPFGGDHRIAVQHPDGKWFYRADDDRWMPVG